MQASAIERLILAIITTGCFSLVIFFLKKWLSGFEGRQKDKLETIRKKQDNINGKVDKVVNSYQACRNELPNRFAEKKKTEDNFGKLFDKVGEVAEGIAHIKGKLG